MKGAVLIPSQTISAHQGLSNVPVHASVYPCTSPPFTSCPFLSQSRVSLSSSPFWIFRKRPLNGSIGTSSISSGRNNFSRPHLWYRNSVVQKINGSGQEGFQGGKDEDDKLKTVPFDWKKVNKIVLTGNLGRNFDLKTVGTGKVLAVSSLAVQRPQTSEVDWFTLEVWERLAERASANLSKGKKVTVEGRIKLRNYVGKDGQPKTDVKVVANSLRFDNMVLDND